MYTGSPRSRWRSTSASASWKTSGFSTGSIASRTSARRSSTPKPFRIIRPSSAAFRTVSALAPLAVKRSCHAAALASWPRPITPCARKPPASASALERRSSVRSRSKKAAACMERVYGRRRGLLLHLPQPLVMAAMIWQVDPRWQGVEDAFRPPGAGGHASGTGIVRHKRPQPGAALRGRRPGLGEQRQRPADRRLPRRRDRLRQRDERAGCVGVRIGFDDGRSCVAGFAEDAVERDRAEERHTQLVGQRRATALAERVAAHVLDDAEELLA